MDSATALREALARLRRPAVLALAVGFTVLGVATVVVQDTITAVQQELVGTTGGDVPAPLVDVLMEQPTPLALPVTLAVALLLFAAVAVLAELLSVVALRVFADWGTLAESATRGIARAVVVGFLAGVVVKSLVLVGLTLLVVPGVFLATALLFAHARVAIAGDGVLRSLRSSWALTSGNRLRVFGVLFVLLGFSLLPVVMGTIVTDETAAALVAGLLLGPANLLSTGLVARAYVALEAEAATRPEDDGEGVSDDGDDGSDEDDGEDPWDQPLGPDDLPEP